MSENEIESYLENNHKYYLTYSLKPHPDGIGAHEILKHGIGACDAIVIGSILKGKDGSHTQAICSLDGKSNKPLSDNELFKFWCMLAGQLAEQASDLEEGKRKFCQVVINSIREFIKNGSEQ